MKIIGGASIMIELLHIFVKNNILKTREIYELEVAKVMFRLAHYNKPVNLSRFITKVRTIHSRTTRFSNENLNYYISHYRIIDKALSIIEL